MIDPRTRTFLFLQGPHGPFFARLAKALSTAGARCWRIGFNLGDRAFWHDPDTYIPVRAGLDGWEQHISRILSERGITDIVLYGDTRPAHASAIRAARDARLGIHVFEEGYLRPYWATYERDGANGNSALMSIPLSDILRTERTGPVEHVEAPAHWGDLRQHIAYGALYHGLVLLGARLYPGYRPHRDIGIAAELRLYLRRILGWPAHATSRAIATQRVLAGGLPYHLCLLQLDHDANFRAHSPFPGIPAFAAEVIGGFATGAPAHHHLVFKAHPLEDGRTALRRSIRSEATRAGIADRVHFIQGGKLSYLLDGARTVVTVNSTAAQQALWRGIPVRAFGRAVYARPGLVSEQDLETFFAAPVPPDHSAYLLFRQFLLETSQLPGGFYSSAGRRQLLRNVVDLMFQPRDPYSLRLHSGAAQGQHLRLVGLEKERRP